VRRSTVALSIFVLTITGCGGAEDSAPSEDTASQQPRTEERPTDDHGYSSACGSAVEAAADIDAMEDAVDDLDPAIVACADLEEFEAAASDHPDALDGTEAGTFVSNRCLYSADEAVTESAICAALSRS
jgi:hypothetical protein